MNWYSTYKYSNNQNVVQDYLTSWKAMKEKMDVYQDNRFVYMGLEDFLLQHGNKFISQQLDDNEMKFLKKTIQQSDKYMPKQCFYNAQYIATASKGIIKYVEGVAYCRLIPMDHAWNTINNKVIDFTWKMLNNDNPILGIIPDGWEYFGLDFEISRQEMMSHIRKHKEVKSFLQNWRDGYPLFQNKYKNPNEINDPK